MFEFAVYEGRRRIKGGVTITVGLALLAIMVIWLYPSFTQSVNLDEILQAYPKSVQSAFGIKTLSTLGGFLAVELYSFAWVILLGLYFAYAAASLIAGDVERERMDMLLSLPVSRSRLVVEKYLSLLVPILIINVVMPVVVLLGATLIDEPISGTAVVAVHALSIPYLLVCASIGLLASVVFDRESIAQRVGLGVVFALFLLESVLQDTDFEAVGALAPMRYYEPSVILVDHQYDIVGGLLLLGAAAVLVIASQQWFSRTDIN